MYLIDRGKLLMQMMHKFHYELPDGCNNSLYGDVIKVIEDVPLIEAEPVRHKHCPYCDAETNDFVPINQAVEYSGIEIALNRQGMLRVRVYESGQETFTTQDIVEIKYCPNCGAKMMPLPELPKGE